MITGSFLRSVRRRALRKGVLYRALDRVEQGILSLAGNLVDTVRSEELGVEIVKILAKLQEAMKSGFQRYIETYGVKKAQNLIKQAEQFGYNLCWLSMKYARYLAFIDYNNPVGWKSA
jgi:hypothetical protein